MHYEEALKSQLDYQAMLESAKNEGIVHGIELGIEQGIERGIEKEREEGRQAQCRLLTHLLRTKFKDISESYIQLLETAETSKLETWIARLMVANSIEAVFRSNDL
jgi:flagellar biosynthesis/type III secretory pathway protein FliH